MGFNGDIVKITLPVIPLDDYRTPVYWDEEDGEWRYLSNHEITDASVNYRCFRNPFTLLIDIEVYSKVIFLLNRIYVMSILLAFINKLVEVGVGDVDDDHFGSLHVSQVGPTSQDMQTEGSPGVLKTDTIHVGFAPLPVLQSHVTVMVPPPTAEALSDSCPGLLKYINQ
jgi:hypothetical protein